MTDHLLATWLLTYAAHSALFTALAALAERTRWGGAASRRDALWKLALLGGCVTSTLFAAVGAAPSGAAVHLPSHSAIAPAVDTTTGSSWLTVGWAAITAMLVLRTVGAWRLGARSAGRRRVIRAGTARLILDGILGPGADRVTLTCSRTLAVPVAFAREICVPVRALRELPLDELRALLAHEAAHVVRRDAGWLMFAAAVRTLGWWQPLNFVAATRLRLAMELCCDEQAAAGPLERAALARCLVRVAEWNVRDCGPVLAAMASRGSALRRRVESLLDDAPRADRGARPWLLVAVLALPVACLAPVVTVASLSRVPEAAARLVRQATIAEPSAPPAGSGPARGALRPAARKPAPAVATPPISAESGGAAVPEIALDARSEASLPSTPVVPSPERPATATAVTTTLRDAIAAARIPPEPAPSRTPLDVPDPDRRGPSWIRRIGPDTTRPKLDVPKPDQRALSWIAQQPRVYATRPQ